MQEFWMPFHLLQNGFMNSERVFVIALFLHSMRWRSFLVLSQYNGHVYLHGHVYDFYFDFCFNWEYICTNPNFRDCLAQFWV